MRKLIRKIRMYLVVAYARRQYKRAKKQADEARLKSNHHWHVVIDPFGESLKVIDRNMFRDFKRRYQDVAIRTLVRNGSKYTVETKTTMVDVLNGAFYSTAITDHIELEARRRAYIDWVVQLSEKK